MNANDLYVIETVAQDLSFLRESWDESIDDASLRRSSNVLRMLLVDGNYGRAWRLAGFSQEPRIIATDLSANLGTIDRSRIVYAQAGGARFQGMELAGALMVNYAMTDRELAQRTGNRSSPLRSEYGLSQFVESDCIIYKGVHIKRREIIQYVANKLGGAHLDVNRSLSKEHKDVLLDELRNTMQLVGKPSIYFELLSIGQAIAQAKDTLRFLERVRNLSSA